jgi:phosphoribosylaminoimidazole-succinocarboxamide synthase
VTPQQATDPNIPSPPTVPGAQPVYSGKVRDIYTIGDDLLLVASDRISAYDRVFPTTIPDKGRILTAMSLFWFDLLRDLVPNHVVPGQVPDLVEGRAVRCRRLSMLPIECVARGYLTGGGLAEYEQVGSVSGIPVPDGLVDGSRLEPPLFTPSTKAIQGRHDEPIDYATVEDQVGKRLAASARDLTLAVYERMAGWARDRGILLADTKVEFGTATDEATELVLADEVGTPDSSRFWPAESYRPGQSQASFDKQVIRDWLRHESGFSGSPDEPMPQIPDEVVVRTRERYLEAYRRLTGSEFAGS